MTDPILTRAFDVICFGGPRDGERKTLPAGTLGWEEWRPVILDPQLKWREDNEPGPEPVSYGREYVGSYVVMPICERDRTARAVWIQAVG